MSYLKKLSLLTLLLFYPLILLGQECNQAVPATTSHLLDQMKGTISDPDTDLMWKKCSEGQHWDANTNSCTGSANTYTWQAALQQAKSINQGIQGENIGYTDWRLPNIKELSSIVELQCWRPSINLNYFPETPSLGYWSSSSNASNSNRAWHIDFYHGYDFWDSKSHRFYVRLVRSGQ